MSTLTLLENKPMSKLTLTGLAYNNYIEWKNQLEDVFADALPHYQWCTDCELTTDYNGTPNSYMVSHETTFPLIDEETGRQWKYHACILTHADGEQDYSVNPFDYQAPEHMNSLAREVMEQWISQPRATTSIEITKRDYLDWVKDSLNVS
ncbi:hypothetical protein HMPREF0044_1106 [Gleimia coleocanis DSM 15436]|uniref:Uncharacterized protein n=2 Tax=Gleimia TaxID=2692113 RepID=C0W0M8_9ACTO|nr:hypothetical protein HMPREF0044_1106 [Gleimia coleocanis DSM 15436]